MKKVILQKRKFGWKDVLRILGIIVMHYIGFYIVFGIIFGFHYWMTKEFFPDFGPMFWGIIYGCLVAPCLNAILHIVYSEAGSPWTRGVMWLHSIFVVTIVLIALLL